MTRMSDAEYVAWLIFAAGVGLILGMAAYLVRGNG